MTVFVADEQQQQPVPLDRLRRLAIDTLAAERVPEAMEVTLLLVDRGAIAELNRLHMGGDGPTDVLAFPLDSPEEAGAEAPAVLGDVVLCPEVAAEQSGQAAAEMEMLVVHGLLHLLGHDHAEPEEREAMFGRTEELLRGFRERHGAPEASDPGEETVR